MCLKWLQKHRKRRKVNKAKVLPLKTTRARARARVAKSAVRENNTCTCRTCDLIRTEKATFQRVKNVLLCYKSNGQCLVCVHPIRNALR